MIFIYMRESGVDGLKSKGLELKIDPYIIKLNFFNLRFLRGQI
jgi:hypothetical protein